MVAISLALAAALVNVPAPERSFCTRLAEEIHMHAKVGEPGQFTRSMLHMKDYLLGGSRSLSMGLDVPDEATIEQFRHIQKSCGTDVNGSFCDLQGPEAFHIVIDGAKHELAVPSGQAARVQVASPQVSCADKIAS